MLTIAQSDTTNAWSLFVDSFDIFSIALIVGSLIAMTLIVRIMMDARRETIAPLAVYQNLREHLMQDNIGLFEKGLNESSAIVSIAASAAYRARDKGKDAMRDAAELAASNMCARWVRPLDTLRIIGELGPLVGLAGTVWGMIIAFVRLGQAGGAAGPTDLSLGISKALFHTMLGLVLAVPCLLVYGLYRSIVEKHCNTAMAQAGEIVDMIPTGTQLDQESSNQ
ncbi:MAG: MotA/TolQ/ExbB proton channel family protein [Phycisphaerales bacterium]|nr:MotA/TolQ/ExbB proton channel family protein [Phycisphaerales bacterium]